MFRSLARALPMTCAIALATFRAGAQTPSEAPPDAPPITLSAAIERTLARNPQLAGFAFRLRAQEGRILSATLTPPLELRTELENVAGTGAATGVEQGEATFALSKVIELGGKRDRRVAVAEAGRDLIELERQAAQLDVLAEVARRFIHVVSDQRQLELTRLATGLAEQTLETVRQRVIAARAPEVELRRARIALARAEIEQEHSEHELLSSRHRLAAMWGETQPQFGPATADLYRVPELGDFETLVARLEGNPDFLRFASEARLRDAEIRLAETRARADLSLSAGVRRLQGTGDQAFVVGFSMPLVGSSRAHGAIAEARALRAQTDAEREALQVRTYAQLFELYQELAHALTETQRLRDTVLPEMEAALEATEYAFRRGRYGYLEWVDAQRELVSVQRALIQAAANAHLYQTEIERLTGEPLPGTQ